MTDLVDGQVCISKDVEQKKVASVLRPYGFESMFTLLFCKKNKDDDLPYSHLDLNGSGGGAFSLPSNFDFSEMDCEKTGPVDAEYQFLHSYARDIFYGLMSTEGPGQLPGIVERRSWGFLPDSPSNQEEQFRMLWDIDWASDNPLKVSSDNPKEVSVLNIVRCIIDATARFYTEHSGIVYTQEQDIEVFIPTSTSTVKRHVLKVKKLVHSKKTKKCKASAESLFKVCVMMPNSKFPPRSVETQSADGTKKKGVKTGVHVIFPNLIVNPEKAMLIRQTCVMMMQKRMAGLENFCHNELEDVIDSAVIGGAGLRLWGSEKVQRCPGIDGVKCVHGKLCKGATMRPCTTCGGTSKQQLLNSQYEFTGMFDLFASSNESKKSLPSLELEWKPACQCERYKFIGIPGLAPHFSVATTQIFQFLVEMGSIRVKNEPLTLGFKRWKGAPSFPGTSAPKKIVQYQNGNVVEYNCLENGTKKPRASYAGTVLPRDDHRAGVAAKAVASINEIYRNIVVDKITLMKKKEYRVFPKSNCDGSHWCLNKGGDHGSSTVYFSIKQEGISQRCWCLKSFNGQQCRKFHGPLTKLKLCELHVLFPGHKKGKKKEAVENYESMQQKDERKRKIEEKLTNAKVNPKKKSKISGLLSNFQTQRKDGISGSFIFESHSNRSASSSLSCDSALSGDDVLKDHDPLQTLANESFRIIGKPAAGKLPMNNYGWFN